MLRASLAGAVDLSALKKRAIDGPEVAATNSGLTGAKDATTAEAEITGLVTELTTSNLRTFMALSDSVPVIVEFYTSRSEHSRDLSLKLAKLIKAAAGSLVLARADADESPDLAQAFSVQSLPSVHVILKGQPVPLFAADQPESAIAEVFQKVLSAATQNGMTGKFSGTDDLESPAEPLVSPKHKAAFEALNSGDLLAAEREFQAVLAESPADVVASEALAQIRLQIRLENVDFEAVLGSTPQDLAAGLLKADALLAMGELDQAFDLILDRFAVQFDEREALRQRLLELFVAVGEGEAVTRARKKLAMLLY
jgi:putative thioredoxin